MKTNSNLKKTYNNLLLIVVFVVNLTTEHLVMVIWTLLFWETIIPITPYTRIMLPRHLT